MKSYRDHLIQSGASLIEALTKLDCLAKDAILFVVNEENTLLGSLTDGDVRRGLLRNLTMDDVVDGFIQSKPKHIKKSNYSVQDIVSLRDNNFKVIPVLDDDERIINVINFRKQESYLPADALIMAGGRGSRLRPLTDTVPKPLLMVGDKPIIEHNIDRLKSFGIDDFHISVRYLGEQLENHYSKVHLDGVKMSFVWEDEPLGTLGAASLIHEFSHDYVLITNSDILTTLNYEDFFVDFLEKGADMAVATIPYQVDIPYAVMETNNGKVTSFREKPTYTYYSNAGIYLVKASLLKSVPKNTFFNATDFMENLIKNGRTLISFPIRSYWLDIGKPEDYEKAQIDIKQLKELL